MNPILLECIWVILWNPPALKCSFGSALIVAPLWVFIIKPLLKYCKISSIFNSNLSKVERKSQNFTAVPRTSTTITNSRAKSPPARRSESPSRKKNNKNNNINKRQGSLEQNQKNQHASNIINSTIHTNNYNSHNITNTALEELFESPNFSQWYCENRPSLLQQVQFRNAQHVWESFTIVIIILLSTFVLPLFSFNNAGATLWTLLHHRYYNNNNNKIINYQNIFLTLEPLLILLASLTLLTSSFMPREAKHTATITLISFLILVGEAGMVQSIGVGAGFIVLLTVVAWRVIHTSG